ncbi:hypothetical protein HPB50_005855 [Hyalomma asiaticum]|uniref:Uncharacterized protein n=1 Tax=Hyalomma asiaticum TaxID=266040 RepID=A0ACB7S4R7_HYAAI|nr:hypothetical protein HPB50_005855 [Hyalomma asiaticum]
MMAPSLVRSMALLATAFVAALSVRPIVDYLEYIRDATGYADSRYKGKLNLLVLDLKTAKLGPKAKKKAGLTLAMNLWKHLWEGGFDVGMNDPLEKIGLMYKQLGINSHRWQGDGLSNCVRFLVPVGRLVEAVKARDSRKGYMDKVYHWTVDLPHFIKKSIEHGVDGIITNRPDNVLHVLNSTPYSELLKVADFRDSPWTRYIEPAVKKDTDRTTEVLGGGDEGEKTKRPPKLDPSEITSFWTH